MTDEEKNAFNKFLGILIRKSHTCKKCEFKSSDGNCFFASECMPNYSWFLEKTGGGSE